MRRRTLGTGKSGHRADRKCTCHQESGAIGAKLVPEGGEEVQELEDLEASCAACQGPPQAGW